jgi:hypothetical protein
VRALVEFYAEHPHFLRLILREENSWAVGVRGSAEQIAMWREGIESTVAGMRFGISQNQFVDDDPEAMARTWMAIQQAHLGYWLEQDMRATPAEITDAPRAAVPTLVLPARGCRGTRRGASA